MLAILTHSPTREFEWDADVIFYLSTLFPGRTQRNPIESNAHNRMRKQND